MFYKGQNSGKIGRGSNAQDDQFKNLAAEELQETTRELRERLADDAPDERISAVLLDIDAELSANLGKPSNAEILAEIMRE